MKALKRFSVFACLAIFAVSASSGALAEDAITVKIANGDDLSFLLLKPDNPKATVVLFPGSRGYLKLASDGEIRKQKKSFLAVNREGFMNKGFMVTVFNPPEGMEDLGVPIDCPSSYKLEQSTA